jgi:hypothetical protein
MDGLGIPILGGLVSMGTFLLCLAVSRFRRFALAALVSPFASSLVFLVGMFIIADMNPAVEYGSDYIPNGHERDATKVDIALWLSSVGVTFMTSAFVCFKAQQFLFRTRQGEPN